MMDNDTNDILGLMSEEEDTTTDAPALPSLNLNFSLSDEDLEGAPEYKTIPANTTLPLEIYQVEVKPGNGQDGKPELRWKVTFKAVDDTWGPGKMVSDFFMIRQTMAWKWGPFLKAAGLIKGAGEIDPRIFTNHTAAEGRTVQARVIGYTWKDASGNYQQSFGNQKKPVPRGGTRIYEALGNYKAVETKQSDEDETLDGMAEFSKDEYL